MKPNTRKTTSIAAAALAAVAILLALGGCMNSPLPPGDASLSMTFILDEAPNNEGVETILPGTSLRGYTNAQGRVKFEGLSPGDYELLARKDGYGEYREKKIRLEAGDNIDLGEIHLSGLPKTGSIAGSVSLEHIPDATVEVRLLGSSHAPIYSATNGSFVFTDVLPGEYTISIQYPGFTVDEPTEVTVEAGITANVGRIEMKLEEDPTPTPAPMPAAPAIPSATGAAPSSAASAAPKAAVAPDTPAILKGYAFFADQQDHSGITVRIVDPPQTTTTDAAGLYLFSNVPPGMRTIRAEAEGYAADEIVDLMVAPGEMTTAPRLELGAGEAALPMAPARIYGQVILKDKGPQPGTQVSLDGAGINTITSSDGSFLFNMAPVGIQDVVVTREGYETFYSEVDVPEDGGDVPVPVINLLPERVFMEVVSSNPAQNAKKVPVTDKVRVEIRFNEQFTPSKAKGAVTVSPNVEFRVDSPEADLITVELLRIGKPRVELETEYFVTISDSLVSNDGHHLEEPYILAFKTGGPRIIDSIPASGAEDVLLAPDEPIVVNFNYPVNLKDLAEKIRITPNTGEVPNVRQSRTPFGQSVEIQVQVAPKRRYRIQIPSSVHTEITDQRYENTPYRINFRSGDYDDLPDQTDDFMNQIDDMVDQ